MKTLMETIVPALLSFGIFSNCFARYEQKIIAFDGVAENSFGRSVSVDGNYAIIGAPSSGGSESGSAYIYIKNGDSWILQQKIEGSSLQGGDLFGSTVSISGDFVIVGAKGFNFGGTIDAGGAYIFKRNGTTWTEEALLKASDKASFDSFGSSVSINGDYAVIGASRDDDGGTNSGSAYIFYYDGANWTEQAKIIASDATATNHFGSSVSTNGDYAVIGVPNSHFNGNESGSAYIFKRTGTNWTEQTKLIASDNFAHKRFGESVSIDSDYVIIGAIEKNSSGNGSAYIYHTDGISWTEQAKITANNGALNDFFGVSVAINGNYAVVGANSSNPNSISKAGSTYIFSRSGTSWNQESIITASDLATDDIFGSSVGISGESIIIGAEQSDALGSNSGSAYYYSTNPFLNGDVTKTISTDSNVSFDEEVVSNTLPDKEETGLDITFSGVTNSATVQCESFNRLPNGTGGIINNPQLLTWEITDNGLNFTNAEIRIDINLLPVTFEFPYLAVIYHRATPGSGNFVALSTSLVGDTLVANTNSFGEFTIGGGDVPINLRPSDLSAEDFFGASVDVCGNYAIIGAYKQDHAFGTDAGAAYIYFKSGNSWAQQAKLTASDPSPHSRFGYSVSIDGDYAIVGAYRNNIDRGAAYIFHRTGTTWAQQAKLTASDAEMLDNFGYSVSIDGEYVVVGAPNEGNSLSQRFGAAYVFHRNGTTWSQNKKIFPASRTHLDQFGYSVSIDGDYLIVGTPTDDDLGTSSGSAYIFKRGGAFWSSTETKLIANDGTADSWFGSSVSISGDYAIVGSHRNNSLSGSAYIFKRNGTSWNQQSKLVGETGSNQFGYSVSINGNYTIVGAGDSPWNAYLFGRSGTSWTQREKFTSSSEGFGYSVSLCDENTIVGAYSDDNLATNSGSAYTFEVNSTSSTDSFVNGNVSHTISSNTTVSFNEGSGNSVEDTGIDITFSGVTNSGTVTCESFLSPPTGTNGINGTVQSITWVITGGGLGFANAEIRIDLNTLPITLTDPNSAVIYHRSNPGSGTFTALPTTLVGNELVANTPSFSEFAIGGGDSPLAVEIESLDAQQVENSIHLSWTTASETDNQGFNIYRKNTQSNYVKIASFKTHEELLGQGNTTGITNYNFVDDSKLEVGETYFYYISDIEFGGVESLHKGLEVKVSFVETNQIVRKFDLEQNFPNPFNPSTNLKFQIAKDSKVSLKIYNLLGKEVKTLVDEFKVAGSYSTLWNGLNNQNKKVGTGIYFAKIKAGDFTKIIKMSLLK